MANDLNTVCIVGNVVRDCGTSERDFGYTQGGLCVATISIASNRMKKSNNGYVDDVSYFEIHLYGKTAENLKPYLRKGQKIAVEGVLKQERWTDKTTGNNVSKVVINANSVQLLGGQKRDDNELNRNVQNTIPQNSFNPNKIYQTANEMQQADNQVFANDGFPEDIPF